MERDTVSVHFVSAAVARLGRAARTRALATAGIPEALLAAPQARVQARSFAALWLAVSKELDDEFFGLDSRRMKVGSFALLCHAVLGSANLDRALKHVLRGFGVFLDDVQAELSLDGQDAVVSVENRIAEPEARRFADEAFLVMVHGLMCWLAGKRIPLSSAAFAYPRPEHAHEYTVMYSEHLSFDAPSTAIRFEARCLGFPIRQKPESLKVFLRTAPQSVFLKYKNEGGLSARIRRHLRKFVGKDNWPVLEQVAHEFHVSPATLRRRLDAEFTNYQGIKDQVRRDAAIYLLCSTEQTVGEIGVAVGFGEPSAFRRAFKAWSGVQPSEYRRRQGGLRTTE
jgi:AraC-like DNA-binding protein